MSYLERAGDLGSRAHREKVVCTLLHKLARRAHWFCPTFCAACDRATMSRTMYKATGEKIRYVDVSGSSAASSLERIGLTRVSAFFRIRRGFPFSS